MHVAGPYGKRSDSCRIMQINSGNSGNPGQAKAQGI